MRYLRFAISPPRSGLVKPVWLGVGTGNNPRMTRFLLVLVALGVLATAAAVASADTRPALRAVDRSPLVVRGTGFDRLERVTLNARTVRGNRVVRHATASRLGVFTARFDVPLGTCSGIRSVTAVGAKGSLAMLRTPIMARECPPPPAD